MIDHMPRQLPDFRRLRGTIKREYEDFVVEEVPLYPFSGEGTHTYVLIEKRGLNTLQAVHDLAHALNVQRRDFGYAGMKDSRAVTRQWLSIEHVPPEAITSLSISRLRVLATTRHGNKLKLGHLKGNRFAIRMRDTDSARADDANQALQTLARLGAPNYFGPQRFGMRNDNHLIGHALLHGEFEEALDLLLGRPIEQEHADIQRARGLYEAGKFDAARNRWPGVYREQRLALKILATGSKKKRALLALDRAMLRFYVSAYQSALFNLVVAERLPRGLGTLDLGDLAWRHANGAVFRVEDVAREQPRADDFEISPSGPLFGPRMTEATGRPAEVERAIYEREQLGADAFTRGVTRAAGGRRPLRFQPHEAALQLGADGRGAYLELTFMLPRGCYATSLLRELFETADAEAEGSVEAEE